MTSSTSISASEPSTIIREHNDQSGSHEKSDGPCLKLKASLLPLTVLELHHYDADQLDRELSEKTRQAPDFFENLPVIIDLEKLSAEEIVPFAELIAQCLSFSIKLVAIRGGHPALQAAAKEAGLGVLAKQKERTQDATTNDDALNEFPEANLAQFKQSVENVSVKEVVKTVIQPQSQQSKIIHHPIRSGQQVYAAEGDLIIMASVSAGAEILADGNIHVYGTLRGRALAGVKGDTRARIFCHSLEAELVSIAGQYKISEDMEKSKLTKPMQIFLDNDALCFKEIEY